MGTQANELYALTEEIKRHALQFESSMTEGILHARRAGELLCRAKQLAGSGNWIAWFRQNDFAFSLVTAQRFMRIYREWPTLEQRILSESDNSNTLTLNTALSVLAEQDQPETCGVESSHPASAERQATTQSLTRDDRLPLCDDEWLTPNCIIEAAENLLGTIDLDPASDGHQIPARRHYTANDDGLDVNCRWDGAVFLNPPLSKDRTRRFIRRLKKEWLSGNVREALLLVPTRTNTDWFCWLNTQPIVLLRDLIADNAHTIDEPLLVAYFGERDCSFFDVFHDLGHRYLPYRNQTKYLVASGTL